MAVEIICVLCTLKAYDAKTECGPPTSCSKTGTVFAGRAVGAHGSAAGEACFTTSMAGYEEAVTDPS